MDNVRKKFQRVQVQTSQILGRAEKTDVLSEVHDVEMKLDRMVAAVEQTRDRLYEFVNKSKSSNESVDKRKSKLKDAVQLEQTLAHHSGELHKDPEHGAALLGGILALYATTVGQMTHDQAKLEIDIESNVLDRFRAYTDEYKEITTMKEKLKRQVLDYDSARRRLTQVSGDSEREISAQDEVDQASMRLENTRDALVANMYTLASKETEIASLFAVLLDLQRSHYLSMVEQLNVLLPVVHRRIATCPNRPVFGCPLEDHLRYTNRQIALVIEVCCAALCELGLDEEGLFRLSGNQTRIRKLKACFDAGEITMVLADYVHDAHSLAGVLKAYLRELPDPLMSTALYSQWAEAGGVSDTDQRNKAIKNVLSMLPPNNYANLRYIIKFLGMLETHESTTRMSAYNLALVIGPNILWSPSAGDNHLGCRLAEIMIVNHDYFFPGEIDFSSKLIGSLVDRTGGFLANLGTHVGPSLSTAHSQSSSPQGTLSKATGQDNVLNNMLAAGQLQTRSKSPSVMSASTDSIPQTVTLRNDGPQPHRAPARRPKTAAPPPPPSKPGGTTPTSAGLYPTLAEPELVVNTSSDELDTSGGSGNSPRPPTKPNPVAVASTGPPQRPPPPKNGQATTLVTAGAQPINKPPPAELSKQPSAPPNLANRPKSYMIGMESGNLVSDDPMPAPRKSLVAEKSVDVPSNVKTHRKTPSETLSTASADSPMKPPVPIKPKNTGSMGSSDSPTTVMNNNVTKL